MKSGLGDMFIATYEPKWSTDNEARQMSADLLTVCLLGDIRFDSMPRAHDVILKSKLLRNLPPPLLCIFKPLMRPNE